MKSIEDKRVCFFLNHQSLIEEWGLLSKQVSPIANEFLFSIVDEIERSTNDLEGNIRFYFKGKSDWPAALLYVGDWQGSGPSPRVAIGLEWSKKKVAFRGDYRPYIGVRVDRSQRGGADLVKKLRDSLQESIKSNHYIRGATTSSWPAHRYMEPEYERFWENLDPFRKELVDEVLNAWSVFSGGVSDVVGSEEAEGDPSETASK